MLTKILLGIVLLMAEQVGVQSGARIGIHNHLNISQGGILNEYSRYGAYRRPYRGALGISLDNNTERSTAIATYTLLKQITIDVTQLGQVRISWDMHAALGTSDVYSCVYVNEVQIAASEVFSNSVPYLNYTYDYDLGFTEGDRIQIYGHRVTAGNSCFVRNFEILYDWRLPGFGDGTVNNLTAALALNDVDELPHTVGV